MTDKPILLLIDDDTRQLDALESAVRKAVGESALEIRRWQPSRDEGPVGDSIAAALAPRPTLVVTDHDLGESGPAGLRGATIISRCRAAAIPVGVYSRHLPDELEEPDLFNFVFESDAELAADAIANIVLGFHQLSALLSARDETEDHDSWSSTLANLLGQPQASNSFSLYSVRTGASHHGLIESLMKERGVEVARHILETYVLGHLLKNSILRYPGPLLDGPTLCSYLAVSDACEAELTELFKACAYDGPFSQLRRFFWHQLVEDQLFEMGGDNFDIDDAFQRRALLAASLKDPGLHPCDHCDGDRGGYRCPYIDRTVCDLPQCSVPTSSWIPQGAYLSRADRDYYDRLSPLLGL